MVRAVMGCWMAVVVVWRGAPDGAVMVGGALSR